MGFITIQQPFVPWSKVAILGMVIPPLIGILIMGPYKPLLTWVDEFIPYYMEISWELIDPGTFGYHLGEDFFTFFQASTQQIQE